MKRPTSSSRTSEGKAYFEKVL